MSSSAAPKNPSVEAIKKQKLIRHSSGVSFTLSEKQTYMQYINDSMEDIIKSSPAVENQDDSTSSNDGSMVPHKLIQDWEPFDVTQESTEDANHDTFFDRFADGVLLCLLLHHADSAIMDLRAVAKSKQTFKMIENHNLALQSAKNLGLVVVNLDTQAMIEAKPMPILSLLAQLMRYDFTNCIRLNNTIQMILLKKENETVRQFLKLDPKELIFRWINFILEKDEQHVDLSEKEVSNINTDFRSCAVYARLIRYIAPNHITEDDLEEIMKAGEEDAEDSGNESDSSTEASKNYHYSKRAEVLIQKLNKLNLTRKVVLTPQDITSGKSHMNLALLGSIFNDYGVASLMDHFTLDPQEMLDLKCEILDITVEDLGKAMPTIRSAEFSSFVAAAKSLSKATKSDDNHQTGILNELKSTQAVASNLQTQLKDQRKQHEENLEHSLQTLREELHKEHSESSEKKLNDALNELKEEHEKAMQNLRDEHAQQIAQLKEEHQEELEVTKSIHQTEAEELNNRIEELTVRLETFKAELNDKDSQANQLRQSMQIETQSTLAERLSLHEEIDRLKNRYLQTRKDLIYVMSTMNGTFQAEEKLATWRFGSLKLPDLKKKSSLQGFMKKRSNGVVKNWKNRFWLLVENYIFYYEDDKEDSKLKGILRLDECRVEGYDRNAKNKKANAENADGFVIYTSKRKMKTQAPSAEEAQAWRSAIIDAGTLKV